MNGRIQSILEGATHHDPEVGRAAFPVSVHLPSNSFGKANLLEMSISVILPVHNAQMRLADDVDRILELLPELSDQFQLVVVDDASTDATEEIASELARWYPQLDYLRTLQVIGPDLAAEYGMRRAVGDVVFVLAGVDELQLANLRRLWERRDDPRLVVAHAPAGPIPLRKGLLQRLMQWGDALRHSEAAGASSVNQLMATSGTQMLRRPALLSLADQKSDRSMRPLLQHESSALGDSIVISDGADVLDRR